MNIVMPKLGESVEEGTVIRWLKKIGDVVERDESVVEITTDKIDTDIPAIESGILAEIMIPEGQTVAIGSVLGIIDTGEKIEPEIVDQKESQVKMDSQPLEAAGKDAESFLEDVETSSNKTEDEDAAPKRFYSP